MRGHPMDNPVWHSLTTEQASFAIGTAHAVRYPTDVAPFVAIERDSAHARRDALSLFDAGEIVYFVGTAPNDLTGWDVLNEGRILQMTWQRTTALPNDRSGIAVLTADDADAMVELTALAFPGFFRRRTHELGHYLGIREHGQLVSMAGERMHATGFQEISGVCTHPAHTGRGYSARLNASLIDSICARDLQPFLHVSSHNERAQALYRRLGFVTRAELRLWHVRRQ